MNPDIMICKNCLKKVIRKNTNDEGDEIIRIECRAISIFAHHHEDDWCAIGVWQNENGELVRYFDKK